MRHEPETLTLADIINSIGFHSDELWYDIVGVEIEGLAEAIENGEGDDFDHASELETDYIDAHKNDKYLVSWPEHVITPRYDSDASYQLTGE